MERGTILQQPKSKFLDQPTQVATIRLDVERRTPIWIITLPTGIVIHVECVSWILRSNTGGFSGWCFYGYAYFSDQRPGVANSSNTSLGAANLDADQWPRGATNYVTSGFMQEVGHSLGLVEPGPPGSIPTGRHGDFHTNDYPDYMNAGYFYPGCSVAPSCDNIRIDCRPVPTTKRDTYVDCGRDTYWDPTPESGEWLCQHFNLATDSLYFSPLASRPLTCPPA